jgi:tetratricopeptide (TPR) repeat protein
MKKLLMPLLLVVVATINIHAQTNTAVSATSGQQSGDDAKEERNKKTALASFSAYQAGDMEAAFKDYDTEVLTYNPGGAPAKRALDSLKMDAKSGYTFSSTAFPDQKNEVLSTAAEGDYVMLYFESTGTWKGEAPVPFKPTGKSFKARDVAIFRLNDAGKITEQHFVMPFSEIISQISEGGEMDINTLGYKLMAQKKMNEAIEVFKLNVKLYPESANTYDSLGEVYAAGGNKKLAIENYEKAVKMNPKNENGKAILAKLKGQ